MLLVRIRLQTFNSPLTIIAVLPGQGLIVLTWIGEVQNEVIPIIFKLFTVKESVIFTCPVIVIVPVEQAIKLHVVTHVAFKFPATIIVPPGIQGIIFEVLTP